jgi:hypothetical protein
MMSAIETFADEIGVKPVGYRTLLTLCLPGHRASPFFSRAQRMDRPLLWPRAVGLRCAAIFLVPDHELTKARRDHVLIRAVFATHCIVL